MRPTLLAAYWLAGALATAGATPALAQGRGAGGAGPAGSVSPAGPAQQAEPEPDSLEPDPAEPEPDPAALAPEAPAAQSAASAADAAGFADIAVAAPPPPPADWLVDGTLRADWALWTQRLSDNPFAKARHSVDLNVRYKKGPLRLVLGGHAEYDFAYLYQRDTYDGPTLNLYEWQLFPREAFAALSLGRFELSAGYQIVVWGHGELVSPLDIAAPRDSREPGLADPIDLRLPALSTRLSYVRGPHRLEAMMIHLTSYGLRPPPYGPFSQLPALFDLPVLTAQGITSQSLLSGRDYQDDTPSFNQQLLLRYAYNGPRVDLAAYAATIIDQRGLFVLSDLTSFAKSTVLELNHQRYYVLGHSGAMPLRSFLLRWELTLELKRPFNTITETTTSLSTGAVDSYLAQTMVGASWTGVRNLTLSLEFNKPWVFQDRSDWLQDPGRPVFAARASYALLRERLHLSATALVIGFQVEQGWLLRGDADFTLREGLKLNLGYITYHTGSEYGPFSGFTSHDRLYLGLRWDFAVL